MKAADTMDLAAGARPGAVTDLGRERLTRIGHGPLEPETGA